VWRQLLLFLVMLPFLDELSDPRLRLDRDPAAERPRQRLLLASGLIETPFAACCTTSSR